MKNQLTFFKSEKTLCCVYHCNSRLLYQVHKDLKFHKLPCTNRDLLLKWVNEIKLPRRISNSMVVCSRHFTDEDYEITVEGEKQLKGGAVPSKHLPMVWRNKFLPRQYGRLIKLLELRGIGRLRLCFEAKLARQIRRAQKKLNEKKHGKKPIENTSKLLEEETADKKEEIVNMAKDVEDTSLSKAAEMISISHTDLTLISDDSPTQNNNILTTNDKEERSLTSEIVIKEEPVSEAEDGEETVEEMLAKMNEEPTDDIHVTQVENINRMDFDYEVAYESDTFACNVCGEEDCDGHEEKFECTPCGRQFDKVRQLNAHNLCHFVRKRGGREGSRAEAMCKLCKKVVSTSKMSLNQHMLTHSKTKSFVCMLCDRAFYDKVSLVQHINSHTIHTNFRCKVCGQCFGAEIDLDLHVKKHKIMKQDYLCRECGQKFRNKQECWAHLNSHYRARSARPGIACEVCGRVLSTRATLREHMFIHSGEKPFECQLCGRKIRHRANFIIHVQGHSLGQPHLCSLCGMGFSKKVALGSHIAAEHPQDRPYLCIICGMRFRTEAKFQKHAVSHDASLEDEL